MGVLGAVMAIAACREAMTPEIPPLTSAAPDGAASASAADDGGPATSTVMAAALAEPRVLAKLVDTPVTLEAKLCERTLVTVVKGKVTVLGEALGPGDVLVLAHGEPFEATGVGTVVWATTPIAPCPVLDRPGASKSVVRAAVAPKLEWAGRTMSAHLDVSTPELYLGRLEGTAAVAEHSHAGSWEVLAVLEAKGSLVVDGTEIRVGPRQIVVIPPGAAHAWKPEPGSRLVAVQMYAPPGPEQRFVALAAAVRDGGVRDAQ
jgi:mannose-6-phosphate isomerase-like protein (cupin superfamily)